MTDLERYTYESGQHARRDMLADERLARHGVVPLWTNVDDAWEFFSEKFLDEPSDALADLFERGWDEYAVMEET